MVPKSAVNAVNIMLRDICQSDTPFAGKIFILGGDFKQVLPVMPKTSRAGIVENCVKSSHLWPLFHMTKLTTNMRAVNDAQFSESLLQLGNGILKSSEHPTDDIIDISKKCNIVQDNIVDEVFGPVLNASEDMFETAILSPTNESSLQLNQMVLKKIQGEEKTYLSAD